MLTPEECEDIRARWAAATPGPWMCPSEEPKALVAVADPRISLLTVDDGFALVYAQTDATAIAAAPADVAALLATVEALRSELAEAVRVLSELEWVRQDWGGSSGFVCPDCDANERNSKGKHEDHCDLAAFLARHGGA